MFILVEDSAETLASSYVQASDLLWLRDRWGQRMERVGDAPILTPCGAGGFKSLSQQHGRTSCRTNRPTRGRPPTSTAVENILDPTQQPHQGG
jgi:hypothetical protein